VPDDDAGANPVNRVERWRLDTGTRVDADFPETFCALFDDGGRTRMLRSEPARVAGGTADA
jgi:hypothetical protein